MITLMSNVLNFDADAQALPDQLIEAAREASRKIKEPNLAKQAFEKLAPALDQYQPDQDFCVACGLLIEKQREPHGMLDFWTDLGEIFPDDLTTLRMMMRWYRRERRAEAGIAKLHALFPHSHSDLEQAEHAALGFAELRVFDEIDRIMTAILPAHPDARAIRMRYIKILNQQSRYLDAKDVADTVQNADRMGASSRDLIDTALRRAAKLSQIYSNDAADIFARIVALIPEPTPAPSTALGAMTFYTGQLGTGGAERQMTRIASAFQKRFQQGQTAGGLALTAPVDVAVRHTTPESGSDFYVPTLRRARVATKALTDCAPVPLTSLQNVPSEIINLLELLPEDVFDATCKLITHFQQQRTQIAYLWQDGGVLFAGLAALIAGVPRILTSFRGLPPNLRPNLYRAELSVLYRAMATLPHVTFSANSQVAATAYEAWLDLAPGSVCVLPNAVLPVVDDHDEVDAVDWANILKQSRDCSRTVLGIFRFDENKRPLLWIEAAAAYLETHEDTRFVMIGTGYQLAACKARVAALDLEDRVFIMGIRENIGFYLLRADLVMHLARMEGLPNVLIEAHLAGVPVLATPAGGTAEIVTNGRTGRILADAENPSLTDITGHLQSLLSDLPKLKAMGQIAKTDAAPRFLLDPIIDRTAKMFQQPERPIP